ncbi:hypothetical protein LGV61_06020 [Desulfurispirillum indicum]|uniref:hypothetical protein n=1 Tax=Desulfurispirillum indicum TaxID=936456 RepID=UPI001CF975EE|nr:hypothetical protein [Desulfurispirillum indicum]UCZ57826.1 hypothetical protein LGV61_06020 [Desulfurispirillum indicum]
MIKKLLFMVLFFFIPLVLGIALAQQAFDGSSFEAGRVAWNSEENPMGISCAGCHFEGYDVVSRGSFPRHNSLADQHMTLLESIEYCMRHHQHLDVPDNNDLYALFQHLSILQENYELNLFLRQRN